MSAVLPDGESYTFWGRGISQGHSNASGSMPRLTTAEKHVRECYVVLQDGADAARVEQDIVNMPYYFADNKTSTALFPYTAR